MLKQMFKVIDFDTNLYKPVLQRVSLPIVKDMAHQR